MHSSDMSSARGGIGPIAGERTVVLGSNQMINKSRILPYRAARGCPHGRRAGRAALRAACFRYHATLGFPFLAAPRC